MSKLAKTISQKQLLIAFLFNNPVDKNLLLGVFVFSQTAKVRYNEAFTNLDATS
jgi:hypothetical protein